MNVIERVETVFQTEWFDLQAKSLLGSRGAPYYSLKLSDYVCVVAKDDQGGLLVVKQFRPAVEKITYELPSGHVDPGETPIQAARRELMEENGCEPLNLRLLAPVLLPDTGRLQNKLWCYCADQLKKVEDWTPDPGVERDILSMIALKSRILGGDFNHALHLAALMLAVQDEFLKF